LIKINWVEFKSFKMHSNKRDDNFEVLLDFLKSYYNMTSPKEMYETMFYDETAQLMLKKRDLKSAEALEKHLFRHFDEL